MWSLWVLNHYTCFLSGYDGDFRQGQISGMGLHGETEGVSSGFPACVSMTACVFWGLWAGYYWVGGAVGSISQFNFPHILYPPCHTTSTKSINQ